MPKAYSTYICQQCGYQSSTYLGKCPQCDSWNSFVETIEKGEGVSGKGKGEKAEIINLSKIQKTDYRRINTGFEEVDRCLGGGIVNGSLVLVSGDPGIGKSTLLTQLALNINQPLAISHSLLAENKKILANSEQLKADSPAVLYVAGEESAQQIKIRVDRITPGANLSVLNEVDVDVITYTIEQQKPSLVIVDSIQTLETNDLNSIAGSVGQVRECAHRLQKIAKALHVPIFIVGHVTKEGTIAGPKTLEHLVDVVLSLEGEASSNFRILRVTKNRFGPTDEVGIFEMEEEGMMEVKNPSKLFIDQKVNAPGSAVAVTMTGYRPLVIEVQALVTKSFLPVPRRVGLGVDSNRLQLLTAVLAKRLGLPLLDKDVFVNITGGLKVNEPAIDLAVSMAIVSSLKDIKIVQKTVFVGEVGLLGELRVVRQMEKRIREAKKLGFSQVISPEIIHSLSEVVKQCII